MPRIIVITGTSTASGKTVLTALLARHLLSRDTGKATQSPARRAGAAPPGRAAPRPEHQPVCIALKPFCSGGRDDARALRKACHNALTLDQVNPWHFRAALAPLLAARKEGRTVALRDVVAHVRLMAHDHELVLVEGAGGLLSPLGDHFSTRELIAALGADVMIAAQNELGVINHVRLTIEALPPLLRLRARICLMTPRNPTAATRTNAALLADFFPPEHVVQLPWLTEAERVQTPLTPNLTEQLATLLHS